VHDMIDIALISKSSGVSLLTAVLGTSFFGISVSSIVIILPVVVAVGGVIYGYGKLNQKITYLQSDVQMIKETLINKENER